MRGSIFRSESMKTSETHPIHVDFLESSAHTVLNRLGMTFAPGKKERYGHGGHWNRDIESDLKRLRDHYRIDTLVSLLEPVELELLKIENLPEACKGLGIEFVRFPIPDLSPPASVSDFTHLMTQIRERLDESLTVAVNCRAGLGRTGLTAACAIVAVSDGGIGPSQAVGMVRSARRGTIETNEQEKFVLDFADRSDPVQN